MADSSYAEWCSAVGSVLAKSRGGTAPDDPIAALTTATEDPDVSIAPLYSARDELPEPPLPGRFPFTRGGVRTPDVRLGWRVAEPIGSDGDNADALNALESGAGALWIVGADPGPLLDGVYPDMAPILLTPGSDGVRRADQVFSALDAASEGAQYQPQLVRVSLGAAPLTSAVVDRDDVSADEATSLARTAASRGEDVRALVVDGADLHNAGATCAQEIGLAAAAGIDQVRTLVSAGLSTSDALRQITFRFAATDDQFLTIAKLRASRAVWARIADRLGSTADGNAPIHAVTSLAATTARDPWVNLLRNTVAAFGAGTGGADFVSTLTYDAALPSSVAGYSPAFARRIARNTQLVLLEESNLGRVVDPAAGSWHVEALTRDLARAAWTVLQEIERAGGFARATADGTIADLIAAAADLRDAVVSRRTKKITGVNEFPNLSEPPVEAGTNTGPRIRSHSAPFDALRLRSDDFLRRHGARPHVRLATIGTVAAHNARSTFVTNLLASGGIEALPLDAVDTQADPPQTRIAVLAGSDAGYADEGAALAEQLRADNDVVLLAGPPGTLDDEDRQRTGLVDGYLHAKVDAAAVLENLLTRLGA